MILLYHQLQAFTFIAITFLFRLSVSIFSKDKDEHTINKIYNNTMYLTMFAITVAYHISLLYLETDLLLYFWFWMTILHFYIHAFIARLTIIQSQKLTYDDLWHFFNQSMAVYYMYSRGVDSLYVTFYGASIGLYFVMLYIWFFKKSKTILIPLYYLGSLLELFFVLALERLEIYQVVLLAASHLAITYTITYNNYIGKKLLSLNVAGAAFLSEFLVIYLIHNKIY